ncbi:MAG TPA: hypothetical protein VFW05_19635, partial [Verrucomicrobiae bacterium]|nr:hypothetical protein [Verrucomicrobiae bacterium]
SLGGEGVISRFEFRKFNPLFGAGAKLRPQRSPAILTAFGQRDKPLKRFFNRRITFSARAKAQC